MSFAKMRILQLWRKEKMKLGYLLPNAKDHLEFLNFGFEMMERMKPYLDRGYYEDFPNRTPSMENLIEWMKQNDREDDSGMWAEMTKEFTWLIEQSKAYDRAHQ